MNTALLDAPPAISEAVTGTEQLQDLHTERESLESQRAGLVDALAQVDAELTRVNTRIVELEHPNTGPTTLHAIGLQQTTIKWLFDALGILHVDQLTHHTEVSIVNRGKPYGLTIEMLGEIKSCLSKNGKSLSEPRADKAA